MDRTDEFINLYKELEAVAVEKYRFPKDGRAVYNLEQRREFRSIKTELDYCRDVRNLLSHNPKVDNVYPVIPSEQMIDLLKETINKVKHPPKAKDIMVPASRIVSKKMEDSVFPVIREMVNNAYTHIPIMKEGAVVGVFSEGTILSYMLDEEIVCTDQDMHFSDIEKYLKIENHKSETFRFVSENDMRASIDDMFSDALLHNDRIGMVFVTHSGKSTEKILGLITAWDLAGTNAYC